MDSWVLIFIRSLFAALLVLVLPGYAVLVWRPDPEQDLLQRLALAVGLSFSLTALLALAFFEFNRPLSGKAVLGFYAVFLGTAAAGWLKNRPWPRGNSRARVFLAFFAALLAWRFFQVRGLAFPPWVDAPHHVLIVRKIMETGILPADLNPYLPVSFYYHFGFHAVTALFAGISGLPLERATLAMGQMLNAAVSLSVYALGRVLWRDSRRAGVAALLSAVVSQMPAYYATWGRYTLISGLVLLPLAMAALLENREAGRARGKVFFLMVLLAGTVLAHYFAGFLLLLFVLVCCGEGLAGLAFSEKARWVPMLKAPLAGLLGGLALIAPWLVTIRGAAEKYVGLAFTPQGPPLDQVYFQGYVEYLFHLLGPWRNYFLLAGAVVGCFYALREPRLRALTLWGLLLTLGILSWGFRLFPFRPDHFAIILFLPACLIAGHGAFEMVERAGRSGRRKVAGSIGLAILGSFCWWGLRETATIIRPVTVFAGAEDLRAIHWIRESTPPEARFLINPTPWEWGIYRGTDGGWWITPLTGRWTSLPPLFYGFGGQDLIEEVNRRAQKTMQTRPGGPEWLRLVREEGITHIYSRAGAEALPPESLSACPELQLAYHRGRVFVFKIN